jgi:hypothetical protein
MATLSLGESWKKRGVRRIGGEGGREREKGERRERKKEREVRKIAATETFRRLRSTFAC